MRKFAIVLVAAVAIVVAGTGTSSASKASRYNELTALDRATRASKESGVEIKISYDKPGNSHKPDSAFKRLQDLPQYTAASALGDDAVRLSEKRVSYGQIVEELEMANPQIHEDRQIWVVVTHFPKGVQTRQGIIQNAIVSEYWDAESGEFLFFDIRSKN